MIDNAKHRSLLYLWQKRTLYVGPLFEPICMKNGAASLAFALSGSMRVNRLGDHRQVECKSFLVPPGVPFRAETGDAIVANCMLDVLGRDFALLSPYMQQKAKKARSEISFEIDSEAEHIQTLKKVYQNQYDAVRAAETLEQLIAPEDRLKGFNYDIDPRVEDVIQLIKNNIECNLSIQYLAASVNISVPHLVRVFKAQTGVPIRRFRLWHRIFVASVLMAKTGDLTTAALGAGFSDASHFLHTFQDMVGMRASLLLNQPNEISIMAEDLM